MFTAKQAAQIMGMGGAKLACAVIRGARKSPAQESALLHFGLIHAAAMDNERKARIGDMEAAQAAYSARMEEAYRARQELEAMTAEEKAAYRKKKMEEAEAAAMEEEKAASKLLEVYQHDLTEVTATCPKIVYMGRNVSAVNMLHKLDKVQKEYDKKKSVFALVDGGRVDAEKRIAQAHKKAQAAAAQAAAAINISAHYPNFGWTEAAQAAAAAWAEYYDAKAHYAKYYGVNYRLYAASIGAELDTLRIEIERMSSVVSAHRAGVTAYEKKLKAARGAVKTAAQAITSANENTRNAHIAVIGYSSESWDIYKNALENAEYAQAFLNICNLIAYHAIKARVISASAAMARSKAVNDTTKNHRQAFYEKACNAGCDARLLEILRQFSFHPMGEKAENIVSSVYTGLAQAYEITLVNKAAAAVPMFIVGMRCAWREIEKERGARVKVGDRRNRAVNVPLSALDNVQGDSVNIGASRPTGLYRAVEVKVENRIFMEEINAFIPKNSPYLHTKHIELLSSIRDGVSIREYAEMMGKDKKVVQRMIDDIQKKLAKVDREEMGKNRRVAVFLNFLDYFKRANRYA